MEIPKKDAKEKALRNNNLDLTWELNITQFCQVHYMSHIMNEYKKNDGDIEDVDMIIDDIEDVDVIERCTPQTPTPRNEQINGQNDQTPNAHSTQQTNASS
nr:11642_t:CDS:2 [Entrophospora candida]